MVKVGSDMKKIIITTFFKAENYGAVLQAYALQTVIRNQGFFVEFLNYRDAAIENDYRLVRLRWNSLYALMRSCAGALLYYTKNKKRHDKFIQFERSHLRIGETEYRYAESIKKNPPLADIYLTGSDQVWNTGITKGISDIYTLNFGSGEILRVSYAASIGNDCLRVNETDLFRERLSRIDALSVREAAAGRCLESLLPEKEISVTLDPVLLRSREEWESDIEGIPAVKEKYILAYFVEADEEYRQIVSDLSAKTGLRVIHFEKRNKTERTLCSVCTAGPLEFVSLIKHAAYVVTTSFHGTAFSIIFHRKFWVVPHRHTGTRVTGLLDLLKISDRAVGSFDEFRARDYNQEIEYVKADAILDRERKKSREWLDKALKNKTEQEAPTDSERIK